MPETAFGAAFKKAGFNPGLAQLYALAAKCLQRHDKTPARALVDFVKEVARQVELRDVLHLDFLQRVVDDMKTATAAERQKKEKKVHIEKYDVPAYDRRPHGAVLAARAAMLAGAEAIYLSRKIDGRPIGEITWAALRRLVSENATNAASFLRLGTTATENALILDKISKYARVSDGSKLVRDIVPPQQLSDMIEQARLEAPRVVERGMRAYAETVQKGIEHNDAETAI